ncbi:hypothetical protein CASFOL_001110 [Castilleja foliolosa]|uniref:Engrailed n=1 Tax=Castilleja foliolosa TaxID=1961234 RepID=A0ABD3EQH6_9LAMI
MTLDPPSPDPLPEFHTQLTHNPPSFNPSHTNSLYNGRSSIQLSRSPSKPQIQPTNSFEHHPNHPHYDSKTQSETPQETLDSSNLVLESRSAVDESAPAPKPDLSKRLIPENGLAVTHSGTDKDISGGEEETVKPWFHFDCSKKSFQRD